MKNCLQIVHSAREINVRCYRTQRVTAERESKESEVRIYFLCCILHGNLYRFDIRCKVEASAPSTGALAILFLRQVDHLRTNTRINLLSAVRCSIVSEPISLDMVSELVFARGYNLWMCHRSQREFLAVQQESDVLRFHTSGNTGA